ncbi:MAG: terpene cyclase, partial [Lentisphaerae bacterium]|nr:terpene cyclase [Lentisphaerota bacterium]
PPPDPARVAAVRPVPVRSLDKKTIHANLRASRDYLIRAIHPKKGGVSQFYDVMEDDFGTRLYTTFTASTAYALLSLHEMQDDPEAAEYARRATEFVLFMQNRDPEDRRFGAFHYSYDLESEEKEPWYVVGTTAKALFTLLRMFDSTGDSRYLDAATLGADWLTTMVREDGTVKPYAKLRDGKWMFSKKTSLLYNGQVLSALSRMFESTGNTAYFEAAESIAHYHAGRVSAEGCYLGDDYRPRNPISSSWVIMSLLDFWRVNDDPRYLEAVFDCSDNLLRRRKKNPSDVLHYGRWAATYYTSGNGWISEVMADVYHLCRDEKRDDCEKYKAATLGVFRWLAGFTYTEKNTDHLPNGERAIGGLIRSPNDPSVRIDSVCHALNAYIGMLDEFKEGILVTVPPTSPP